MPRPRTPRAAGERRGGRPRRRWITLSAIALTVLCRRTRRSLTVIVNFDPTALGEDDGNPGGLLAVALEGDATMPAPVFGAHAHDVVGRFDRMTECEAACEAYADRWLERQGELPPCDCGPIGANLEATPDGPRDPSAPTPKSARLAVT